MVQSRLKVCLLEFSEFGTESRIRISIWIRLSGYYGNRILVNPITIFFFSKPIHIKQPIERFNLLPKDLAKITKI